MKDRAILEHTDSSTSIQGSAPGVEQCEDQVRRVLRSNTFRNATTLQQLASFLASRSIAGTAENLKEYTIGVEALGRKSDFEDNGIPRQTGKGAPGDTFSANSESDLPF